jgi:hypothetical protein
MSSDRSSQLGLACQWQARLLWLDKSKSLISTLMEDTIVTAGCAGLIGSRQSWQSNPPRLS